jgi:hypothetical protein
VVGTVLGVAVGLNVPHCEVGVQAHWTPAKLESLATVAAMPQVWLTPMELGGTKPGEKDTVMGTWLECWLPQADKKIQRVAKAKAWSHEERNLRRRASIGSWIGRV